LYATESVEEVPRYVTPEVVWELRERYRQQYLRSIVTVAAVSLAWVHSRPGVTSTIIGARTMKQLDSNLAALDLPLSTDHIERLDKLSEPKLNVPAQIMRIAPNFSNAGATVNGVESTLLPQGSKDLEDHY
jgi:hypothetical protein